MCQKLQSKLKKDTFSFKKCCQLEVFEVVVLFEEGVMVVAVRVEMLGVGVVEVV